jgi:putative tricarboxylic transport membrane protein
MQRDLVFGCATLALAGGYYLLSAALPHSLLDDAIGPQGLPKAYAVLLAGLSVLQIARALVRRPAAAAPAPRQGGHLHKLRRAMGMLMIGAVYLALVPWLGYILSLAGLILATIRYQGGAGVRRAATIAVTGALFFWLLFVLLLGIPQPAGFWPSLR